MRQTFALVAAVCLVTVASIPWNSVRAAQPAITPTAIDAALEAFRADMQTNRAEVMAKNLSLTAEQAAKFWPVYDAYQKEQNVIMDEHFKGLQRYIESADMLDDAGALALIQTHLDRDAKMTSLRQAALGSFQSAVGTKLAARAIQIDRRLSLAYQLQILTAIPLVH